MTKEYWLLLIQELVAGILSNKVSFIALSVMGGTFFLSLFALGIVVYKHATLIIPKGVRWSYDFTFFVLLPLVAYKTTVWVPMAHMEVPTIILYLGSWIVLGFFLGVPVAGIVLTIDSWRRKRKVPVEAYLTVLVYVGVIAVGRFTYWLFF